MNKILLVITLAVLVLMGGFAWDRVREQSNKDTAAGSQSENQAFNKSLYPIDSPASIWVIVNKSRPLQPTSYDPQDLRLPDVPLRSGKDSPEMQLRDVTAGALEELFAAASSAGYKLMLVSGHRSYSYQSGLYNTYVKKQGKAVADTQSARAGFSEHQTGLAADVGPVSRKCEIEECFAETPEGKWLAANAYKYGFVIRYAQGKQSVTGYVYEPWHLRYVGKPLAKELHTQGNPALEEFFGLPAAPDYP